MRRLAAWCLCGIALAGSAVDRAKADPVADFYHNRNINLYIGYSVGGGYDTYARVLAQHLGRQPIRARLTASICWSPPDVVPAFWLMRSASRGNRASTRFLSAAIPALSLRRKAPRSRFSSTVIRGKMRRPSDDWQIPRPTIS